MKGFIEVTDIFDNNKMLLSIDKIFDIEQQSDNTAFIVMCVNDEGEVMGVNTIETYDIIKDKIRFSEVTIC